MRRAIHRERQSVVFACLAVLLAAGAWHGVRADGQDDDRSSNDLRVIGLTDDGRLVSFRARSPERTRDLGFITTTLDQLVIQSPPGNGILVATGKLGVDAAAAAGFDIYSLLVNGVTVANFPFATLSVNGKYRFYAVSLTTGQAFSLGRFDEAVVDIAVPLNQ